MDQETAENGLQATQKIKPAAFYDKKSASLITCLNYNDHLDRLAECDWIIEAISERIDWKRDLYIKINKYIKDSAALTSNTSGISLKELSLTSLAFSPKIALKSFSSGG